jgi:histidine ammonia-lyase
MGTNSAQFTARVIENTYQVLSIEMLTLIQAIDHLDAVAGLSSYNREKYLQLRNLVPRFEEDTIKYLEIKKIKDYLCNLFIKIES